MTRFLQKFLGAALALSLVACQTINTSGSLTQAQLPPIASKLVTNGKGVPNGRSDTAQPFFPSPLAVSDEPGYGYSQGKSIGVPIRLHPLYLNALRGPRGEPVEYERLGSCCAFPSPGTVSGFGLLDIYRIRIDGSPQPIFLFLNGYAPARPLLPAGFTQRVRQPASPGAS